MFESSEGRARLEALLFASGTPLTAEKIAEAMEISEEDVLALITELSTELDKPGHGIQIRKVAGGFQLTTRPEMKETVTRLLELREVKLSNAAMETLAIIAFKQPVTRGEIEAIRGVKVDGVVNTLLENGLIAEAGRKEVLGRPLLYVTTSLFLTTFGLDSLNDLPEIPTELLEKVGERTPDEIDTDSVISEPLFEEEDPLKQKQDEFIEEQEKQEKEQQ